MAARWMGWDTAWVSEIEPYAASILRRHWPNAPNLGDIRRIDGRAVERVDVLCGGFPCQDISVAGKGVGIGGERSGLWKEYARLIDEIRPRYVVAENVSALRTRGLEVVLQDLHALGYDAEWHCIPASYVGAPHRRDRIWIVAHTRGAGLSRPIADDSVLVTAKAALTELGDDVARPWLALAGDSRRLRSDDGIPLSIHRKRLHACGNGLVPQEAFLLFYAIARREASAPLNG